MATVPDLIPRAVARARRLGGTARGRVPLVDHGLRTWMHYTRAMGNQHAGAVTYFGFLSLFPILALAFAVVGYMVRFAPDAEENLTEAITDVLPGVVGTGPNQINLQAIADHATSVGLFGLVGLLYAGLGGVAAIRQALRAIWRMPPRVGQFVRAKATDAGALLAVGSGALIALGISSAATSLMGWTLDELDITSAATRVVLQLLAYLLAISGYFLLLLAMFRWLPGRRIGWRPLVAGALLGAIALEVLTLLGSVFVALTSSNKLYGTFAILVGLLVWLNVVFRTVLLAGAWAVTGDDPAAGAPNHDAGAAL